MQALILCGGKGERLKPLTNKLPKPLIKIDKQPILGHLINYLYNKNIDNFVLATGYKSEFIEKYINESYRNFNIKVINSGDVDIMFRILDCKHLLDEKFLLCYGDTLADIDINALNNYHSEHNGKATISSYQLQSQFGIIKANRYGLVKEFVEKPRLDAWINIGYFIIEKSIITHKNNNFAHFISILANTDQLYSYRHKGLHITVNTLSELKKAKEEIQHFS